MSRRGKRVASIRGSKECEGTERWNGLSFVVFT